MLRASASLDRSVGVDRKRNIIKGFVVAELGEFKDKRGYFDRESLEKIVEMGNAESSRGRRGLRSRLSHPNESDDGLTKHLGRAKNFRLSDDGSKVRADLHLASVALQEPVGGGKPIGKYVMDLASEDPGALGSSLVIKPARIERKGADGERLPDKWLPVELHASDIVSNGDAVHGDLLDANGLEAFFEGSDRRIPTKLAAVGAQYLDKAFPDEPRETIETRFNQFLTRYLSLRFGADDLPQPNEETDMDAETKAAIEQLQKNADSRIESLSKSIEALSKVVTDDIESRKKSEEAETLKASRMKAITELCDLAGVNKASEYIADESLSVEDVRAKLLAIKQQKNPGSGTGETLSECDKIRRVWDEKKEYLTKTVGWGEDDREDYVQCECERLGVKYEKPAA